MSTAAQRVRRGLFATAVALALGFGGAQAMAAPAPADEPALKCNPTGCDRSCRARGGFAGRCTEEGLCACLF